MTAIALTDSVHTVKPVDNSTAFWLNRNCINYVTSDNPVDSFELSKQYDCQKRSAGTLVHEETSWNAMTCIFKFFENVQKQESLTSMTESLADEDLHNFDTINQDMINMVTDLNIDGDEEHYLSTEILADADTEMEDTNAELTNIESSTHVSF